LSAIRTAVFIEEQGIDPADEWDPQDATAQHFIAERDGEVVGCARVLEHRKIGRMAVLASVRRHNVGSKLLRHAIDSIHQSGNTPTLGAQNLGHGLLCQSRLFAVWGGIQRCRHWTIAPWS
jgi:Predicted acyltransferase